MKNLIFLSTAIFCGLIARAGDGEYAVSRIPPELLKNANAVKRIEYNRFEVFNKKKAIHYYKVAYTILNEKGDKFAQCDEYYDKLQSINFIEGTLFDGDGKKIKSLKKSDIQDKSGTDEGSLADDNRIKHHNFYCKIYPYTVEYEVEIKYEYTMFYPEWIPQEDENISVQAAKREVIMPEGMDFRYKAYNIKNEVVITKDKSSRIYTWSVRDLPAIEREVFAPSWYEIAPAICMAPVQFAIEGYEGNMSSWQDYGKFVYALKEGRDVLPDNIKATVHQLTDGVQDPHQKVAILYHLLQKNTRYISIQLGIGGWQPFNAQYVAANRYGDCKALSNYMYALLKEAGIKSYYTLVKAGDGRNFFITDFPSSQFNHVIVSVPLKADTMWLECTSQDKAPGYMGKFTGNRPVLLIGEDGGKLIKTPKYNLKDNLLIRHINADLDMEGGLKMDIISSYRALQEDDLHGLINNYSKEKVNDYLKTQIELPSYDIISSGYKEEASALPSITETLRIKATNYAQVSGKRIFISYNTISKSHRKLPATDLRKYDIDLNYEYTDIDSVQINVPEGYQPESMPQAVAVESPFGRYSASVLFKDNKITYYRCMEQYSGRFPAKDYAELTKFYDRIYKADRNRVVLIKQ